MKSGLQEDGSFILDGEPEPDYGGGFASILKYSASQPRVPGGSPEGGQFTSTGAVLTDTPEFKQWFGDSRVRYPTVYTPYTEEEIQERGAKILATYGGYALRHLDLSAAATDPVMKEKRLAAARESQAFGKEMAQQAMDKMRQRDARSGQPRPMYHATMDDIYVFRTGKAGAIYLAEVPSDATEVMRYKHADLSGMRLMKVYVRAENPFDYYTHAAALAKYLMEHDPSIMKERPRPLDEDHQPLNVSLFEQISMGDWQIIERPKAQEYIRAHHDGFWERESWGSGRTLAVFDPKQIKSAISNTGRFDPDDPDITKSEFKSILKANPYHEPAGSPKGGQFASKLVPGSHNDVPPQPGTTLLREDYIRLYHQTSEAALHSIARTGLNLEHAQGIEGPRAIYADEQGFYGAPESRPTLEFQVPKEKWDPPFVLQDVPPQDMLAVHLPWHYHARYIEAHEEVKAQALAGKLDTLLGSYAPAVAYIKAQYGKTTKWDPSQPRVPAGSSEGGQFVSPASSVQLPSQSGGKKYSQQEIAQVVQILQSAATQYQVLKLTGANTDDMMESYAVVKNTEAALGSMMDLSTAQELIHYAHTAAKEEALASVEDSPESISRRNARAAQDQAGLATQHGDLAQRLAFDQIEFHWRNKSDVFEAHQKQQLARLSQGQADALYQYTDSLFNPINKYVGAMGLALQRQQPLPEGLGARWKLWQAALMDEALVGSTVGVDLLLRRNMSAKYLENQLGSDPRQWVGKIYKEHAYASASLRQDFRGMFASAAKNKPAQLTLRLPKASPGLWVERLSHAVPEQEVLLPRGMVYRVNKAGFNAKGVLQVELDALGSFPNPLPDQ